MKHYIIVKFIDEYDYKSNLENIKALFYESKSINGVIDIDIRINGINKPKRYDLMIQLIMKDEKTLELFDASIVHKKWKELYGKYVLDKVIFDEVD